MDIWEARDLLRKGFEEATDSILQGSEVRTLEPLLPDPEELLRLGREGGQAAWGPLLWRAAVGDTWNTTRAADFLRVTRQALYKRIQSGTVLALPGRGTSEFPVWQFDPGTRLVRHAVAGIIAAFRRADDQVSPLTIAGWANAPSQRLDGMTPAQWLCGGRDGQAVISAAHRDARGLAS